MLDIKFIRENKDIVAAAVIKKHVKFDIDQLIALDDSRRTLMTELEGKRAKQNAANEGITKAANPEERTKLIADMKLLKVDMEAGEARLKDIMKEWQDLMLRVPNVPDMSVPDGNTEEDNKEFKVWGDKTAFAFEPKDHVELMAALGMVDFERGGKVHGFRGYYLTGDGVRLCFAIWQYALEFFAGNGQNGAQGKSFVPIMPPTIVRKINLYGTAHLPGDVEDFYMTQDGDALAGTAEVPLMGMYAEEVLPAESLPKRYLGFSACYRREAGAHGKDVRGLIRVHEFYKFEQLVICEANLSVSRITLSSIVAATLVLVRSKNMTLNFGFQRKVNIAKFHPHHISMISSADVSTSATKTQKVRCATLIHLTRPLYRLRVSLFLLLRISSKLMVR